MFKIGDKVSWQTRNKWRSNPKFQPSFLTFEGKIVSTAPLAAEYKTVRGANDELYTHQVEFRQLKNSKWIPKHEKKDDPKGRLYLKESAE